jgi:hypothetical protein
MVKFALSLIKPDFTPCKDPAYGPMQPTQLENTIVDISTVTASEKSIGNKSLMV